MVDSKPDLGPSYQRFPKLEDNVDISIRLGINQLLVKVWRAKLKETGEEVAVKLLDLENVNCSLVSFCSSVSLTHSLLKVSAFKFV